MLARWVSGVGLLWCGRQNFLPAENFWEVVINELRPTSRDMDRREDGRGRRRRSAWRQVFGGKCAVK